VRSLLTAIVAGLLGFAAARIAARGAAQVAEELALHDFERAQQWAESLSGPAREAAWAAIGRIRIEPRPRPPGPDRDAMLRRRTFDDVMWQVNRGAVSNPG